MYLKSIEIQGFKSFANKIRLEFQPGFTGIVGPNGSGKSNIADAVRWVLGEQRVKQLRGGSMQDVIFAGTELRKPLSFAYVAITMDNEDHALPVDYPEVTVARRLYRSGESEYIMNGTNVRLKDVQELFMDTGIGKEGYSIIGQGQIDKILSDKPEDRRELFDEAAGIVKFKHRKEESLKKLDSEQSNLTRVNDILSELEKQVGPLEKQAQKAQEYLKEREALKKVDINAFLLENQKTGDELADLKGKTEVAQHDLDETARRLEESRKDYEEVSVRLEELDHELEETRNQITQASVVRSRQESDVKVFEEQIRSAKSNASHFEERRTSVEADIDARRTELTKARSGQETISEEIAAQEKKRQEAQNILLETQDKENSLSARIDAMRSSGLDLLNQRSQVKAREASLATKKEQFEIRQSELASKLISASSDEAEHDARIKELTEQASSVQQEMDQITARQKELDSSIAQKKQTLTSLDEELRQTETHYHQEKSRLDALTNLTERYEGFGSSVRHVMEQKSREPGLVGVVADLIKTEPRYENAIEVALGGSIQNIVTQDEDTAKRMIALLKRDHAGRATFLPVSNISNTQNFNMMGILHEPGIIGLADTLVKVAPEYRVVARSLLGRTVVADSFDHAAAAERKFGHKCRMVTLEGELFTPGGAISGGAFRNSSNLLGRRREMADLAARSKELQEKMQQLSAEIETTKSDRNTLRAKAETARMEQQNKVLELNRLQILVNQEQERKKESREGYESLREENDSIEQTRADLQKEEKEISASLASFAKAQQDNENSIEALQEQQKKIREQEDRERQAVSDLDVALEKVRSKASFQKENEDRLQEELNRLQEEHKEILDSIQQGSASMEDKQRQIEAARTAIEEASAAEEKARERLASRNADRSTLSERQKKLLEERESASEDKARLDKEVFRLNTRTEQLENSIDSQVNYIWTEYQLTLTQAAELRDESLNDLGAMKTQIKAAKERIRALGSVNVNAIEEYKDVSQRYEFMKGQRDDLVKAADSLRKIIDELDENMRRQFKEQFAKIQKEFDSVFKQLFGGGSGRLELMEDEDLLTAGVRVIAQPPGKKLVNMMQMSGGEKALTAISLLFAIQNLKPSPFCLLDEIEAALDESNVIRFADYIHKLTAHTQFIVITHRRGTMDRADRLYGITMQEKGVSALVSVNLLDEKDLTA